MKSSPSPVAVFAGLAIAAGLVYLVAVHWWFTAPMLRMGDEITALRMEELTLRMEIAQKPQLEAELARVRAFEAGNPGFLQETNRQLATAAPVRPGSPAGSGARARRWADAARRAHRARRNRARAGRGPTARAPRAARRTVAGSQPPAGTSAAVLR